MSYVHKKHRNTEKINCKYFPHTLRVRSEVRDQCQRQGPTVETGLPHNSIHVHNFSMGLVWGNDDVADGHMLCSRVHRMQLEAMMRSVGMSRLWRNSFYLCSKENMSTSWLQYKNKTTILGYRSKRNNEYGIEK